MIRMYLAVVVLLTALLLGADSAWGEIITIDLTGEIKEVSDIFAGQINVGDEISGYYVYDSEAADTDPTGTSGVYQYYQWPYGIVLNAGAYMFQTDPNNVDFLINVGNNHVHPTTDSYGVGSYNNLPLGNGVDVDLIGWSLYDDTGTALSSDELPTIAPVLGDWLDGNRLDIDGSADGGCPFLLLRAEVTSAVPEPATILLLGLGGVILLRRKCTTA